MARIFISYAHDDQAAAKRIVDALAREGLVAWWDHEIPPGRTWDEVIGQRIAAADVVMVIWSRHSVGSNFVKEEAQLAYEAGKLLPLRIEDVEPPVGFRRVHAANLIGWRGDAQFQPWRAALGEIHQRLNSPPRPAPRPNQPRRASLSPVLGFGAAAAALILAVGGAYIFTRPQGSQAAQEQIAPPEPEVSASIAPQPAPAQPSAAPTAPQPESWRQTLSRAPWRGVWHNAAGDFEYEAVMSLTTAADGRVAGQIHWTLVRSPRSQEQARVGMEAIEYVEGAYNTETRALFLEGMRKDDPANIIGLDSYRLVLSADGRQLAGATNNNGTWGGTIAFRP